MPPSIPRPSMARLPSSLPSSTRRTTAQILRPIQQHPFTTSPSTSSPITIPPESPNFIRLPEAPQSSESKPTRHRGFLPVPRPIFHARNKGPSKLAPAFVPRTTPRSKRELAGLPPTDDKDAWRRRAADSRRASLEQGIKGLWERKIAREDAQLKRSRAKQARNQHAALRMPDDVDEVLTAATVPKALLETAVVRDPDYKAKQLASRARTEEMIAAKAEARMDALQTLYIAAGDFIVNEEQLEARVDELFGEDYWVKRGAAGDIRGGMGLNEWETGLKPPTLRSIFNTQVGLANRGATAPSGFGEQDRTEKRRQILTDTLTGGKLE